MVLARLWWYTSLIIWEAKTGRSLSSKLEASWSTEWVPHIETLLKNKFKEKKKPSTFPTEHKLIFQLLSPYPQNMDLNYRQCKDTQANVTAVLNNGRSHGGARRQREVLEWTEVWTQLITWVGRMGFMFPASYKAGVCIPSIGEDFVFSKDSGEEAIYTTLLRSFSDINASVIKLIFVPYSEDSLLG